MHWDEQIEARFNELRLRQLRAGLDTAEQEELDDLVAMLEGEEAAELAPALAQMRQEQLALRQQLAQLHEENEALAALAHQQEQLVFEARQWLAVFQARHQRLQKAYQALTKQVLPSL